MSKLFNHNTGKWEVLDEGAVDDAVRSGDHTFYKDIEVPVVTPDGELGTIPSANAYEAFNNGYRWQTKEDRQAWESGNLEAIKRKNFGKQSGAAAAMGALDTATFGASSAAIRGLDESGALGTGLTEAAREIKDRNTGAYIAGAVASMAIPGAAAKIASVGTKAANAGLRAAELGEIGAQAATAAPAALETAVNLPGQVAKLGLGVEKATETAIRSAVTGGMKEGFAKNLIEQTTKKIASGIVEGTAYGVGAGISEASLGRPEDVVDTLISNTGFGAITGGVFGSIIGGAPVIGSKLKDLGGKAISGIRSTVEEAARNTFRNAAVASAKSKGVSEELVNVLRESFNDEGLVKTAMDLHAEGKIDEFNKFVKETEKELRKTTTKSAKDLDKSINAALTATKGETKEYIKRTIKESGNDVYNAVNAIENDMKTTYAAFDDALANSDPYAGKARVNGPALADMIESNRKLFKNDTTRNIFRDAVTSLREPGLSAMDESAVLGRVRQALPDIFNSPAAKKARDEILGVVDSVTVKGTPEELLSSWGRRIGKLANSEEGDLASIGRDLTAKFNVLKNAGSEAESFAALRSLKQAATEMVVDKVGGSAVRNLNSELVDHLRNHPNKALAGQLLSADTYYHAYKVMQKELVNSSGIKSGKLSRLFNDPTYGSRLKPAMDRFAEFMPEVENVIKNTGNVKAKTRALTDLANEMNTRMQLTDSGKLSAEDLRGLFDIIGVNKNITSKIDKLEATTKLLQETASMSVPDRLVHLARAIGDEASVARVQSMLPHADIMEKIAQLKAIGARPEASNAYMDLAANAAAYHTLGPAGPAGLAVLKTARNVQRSPWTANETFRSLQGVTNAGAKAADTLWKAVNTGLFTGSSKAAKIAMPAYIMSQSVTDGSRKEKLAQFEMLRKHLPEAASPESITQTMEANLGHVSNIPNIKSALVTRMGNTAQFLQAKMPTDPTAQYTIVGHESGWEPSDQELNTYLNRVNAANNPLQSLAKVADGSITPEEIETVQTLHPNLFNGLRKSVIDGIIASKGNVPYQSKLIISNVFSIPVDYSTSAEFVNRMQSAYTPVDKGGRPETPETRKKNLNINPLDSMTEASKISYGRGK